MTKFYTLLCCTFFAGNRLKSQDAAQPDTTAPLRELLVSYQAERSTPVTFQNLSSKELKVRSTGQEPAFLFSETPSVTAYSDAGNTQGYAYFRLRGIDQTRINTTLDGVPMNEPEDQGAYFSNYPDILNSVSKVQIQRGVGTSKNGVASYGGSVLLFSPDLHDSSRTTVGLGYGSFNSFRAFAEYNSGVRSRKALYVRASQVYSDGYKYNAGNNAQSVFISSGLFLDKASWKINVLAGHQRNELAWLGVPDSLITEEGRTNANSNEKDRFAQALVQVLNNWQFARFSSFQTSVYYTFLQGDYDFNLNNFLGLPATDELYNYAFKSNLSGFFSNYRFSKNGFNWITGIHANIYDRQHTGSEKTAGQLYRNTGYKNELSVFTKADYTFGRFDFFADLQYRYAAFRYAGSVPLPGMHWNFLNPRAGVSFAVRPNSVFYYSIGSTGREPTRNDLFGGSDDLPADSLGRAVLSDKTPERVLDHELGFRHAAHPIDFSVNLYYLDFRNEIVLDGKFGPNGLALTNKVDKSFRTGLECSLKWNVGKHLALINNSSFNYSRIRAQEEVFSPVLTPPVIVNQEAVYTRERISVALSCRYQSRSFIDFANSADLKSYALLNGRISYAVRDFEFSAFVNNLSDARYFNNGYVDFDGSRKYFVQAPRNYYGSVKYRF